MVYNATMQKGTKLLLQIPNGGEELITGQAHTITWQSLGNGTIDNVKIEVSDDNGSTWGQVCPVNQGNTGSYEWTVPNVTSDHCLVRVSDADLPEMDVYDKSDATFRIYPCAVADLTGDCEVDLVDFAEMAADWLEP